MQVEVFESDAEVIDAAATLAETLLAAETAAHPSVAIAGGRSGRAFMLALASRDGLPWSRLRLCVADESCGSEPGAVSNRHVLRQHVLVPRGLGQDEEGRRGIEGAAAERAAYAAEVETIAGRDVTFDLVLLELGPQGELGVLAPASAALSEANAGVVQVGDRRIGLGPGALGRARRVIVLAVGSQCRQALAAALRPTSDRLPAHLVAPSARVTWLVDRAAASVLLRDARAVRA